MVEGLEHERYHVKDLGVKQAPFYVLIGADMPAVLAEISFITNPDEAKLLKKKKYLQTIAQQLAAGVVSYIKHRKITALDQ
ncbi:MAG: N-acetylmuramoyl-L-alanine amidase [Candidatus Electrothrix sp. AR3]|nr:N-acetylmuramoyl-L-alanine amidase [Candidatus Electrothrix sp. AR3]